jgi:hypothetical protein
MAYNYEAEPALLFRDLWSRMGWDMKTLLGLIVVLLLSLAFAPAKAKPVIYDPRAVCDAVLAKELDAPSLRFVRYDTRSAIAPTHIFMSAG